MYADTNNPQMQDFINKYKITYNTEINTTLYWVSSAYDVTKLTLSIIKTCGEDTNCIKQELYRTNYDGVSGKIQFDSNGDGLPPLALHYWDENKNEHWAPIK
jgi:branched-chain amino acid transport system substrate-binding protein